MNKIHFQNQQQVIMDSLKHAQKEVLIAVAWLNFELYSDIFISLAARNVKVKIVVNDDKKNSQHEAWIKQLKNVGIKIKLLRMWSHWNYMHHKFCIIDNKKLLIGSFNWSKNANNNFENLMELYDESIINPTRDEFSYLWGLNKKTIELQKQLKCSACRERTFKILIVHLKAEDDHEYTECKIVSVCGCEDKYEDLDREYINPSFYHSIVSIADYYNEQTEHLSDFPEQLAILEEEYDYDIKKFLQQLQSQFSIHAVALLEYNSISMDGEGEWSTEVIWKDRFAFGIKKSFEGSFVLI